MTVSCPECRSVFRVDPAKVPATGVRARCSVCGGVMAIAGGTLPVAVTPLGGSSGGPALSGGVSRATPAAVTVSTAVSGAASAQPVPAGTPLSAAPAVAPGLAPSTDTPADAPTEAPAAPTPRYAAAARLTPVASRTPVAARAVVPTPGVGQPAAVPRTPTPHASMAPSPDAVPVSFPLAGIRTPAASATPVRSAAAVPAPAFPGALPTPASVPTPVSVGAGTGTVAGAAPRVSTAAPTPAWQAPSVAAPTPAGGRAPINPFLRADPSQRARRLARALVSDLVAYHPQKREEGLRDGTLRQLFREEIKKSYEEYVDQVGREQAEAAPHFQDALNDILAGGRRLF